MSYNDIISDVQVYGLEESIKASKYPMATDTDKCSTEITKTTKMLGTCGMGEAHDQFLTGVTV